MKTIKLEDVEKYVALAKDGVQLGINLIPDDTVAKKVVRVVDALLAKDCVAETAVFLYNVVATFGNKVDFENILNGADVKVVSPLPLPIV